VKSTHIIVQAGGQGSRLKHHTYNKPKALVSIDNEPIIFHLFNKFPRDHFQIIVDYKSDVLERYLETYAKNVDYNIVNGLGCKGTCSGVRYALDALPEDEEFILIWSDLILPKELTIPENGNNHIGIAKGLDCRWGFVNGNFEEACTCDSGIAGMFVFKDKSEISDVPLSGEFVRWLKDKNLKFDVLDITGTREYGLIEKLNLPAEGKCRPFNSIRKEGDCLVKEGVDEVGKGLATREIAWYKHVMKLGYSSIPKIHSFEPLKMQYIQGKNIYSYKFDQEKKETVLNDIIDNLRSLHELEKVCVHQESMKEAYFTKTISRMNTVKSLIPQTSQETIKINGVECRNIFFVQDEVEDAINHLNCPEFCLIHGDCTFSNIMLENDTTPVLLDPRGYFGMTELHGDPAYDWAKLYYSLFGNYDQFNLRRFELKIEEDVQLDIQSNGWEDMSDRFFDILSDEIDEESMKLMHAMIWLSLTTYARDDYDSICGAFYNGLYHLEDYFRSRED
jgi:Nucleoside-diphosphate-sugar pyrophosphorylase involved in lipopolysaccharide biosynthesis/translation initiation factor 2B, gamma/epsilon subunits (eIF-2Bgamma/eIF-2Bepsilon)